MMLGAFCTVNCGEVDTCAPELRLVPLLALPSCAPVVAALLAVVRPLAAAPRSFKIAGGANRRWGGALADAT